MMLRMIVVSGTHIKFCALRHYNKSPHEHRGPIQLLKCSITYMLNYKCQYLKLPFGLIFVLF